MSAWSAGQCAGGEAQGMNRKDTTIAALAVVFAASTSALIANRRQRHERARQAESRWRQRREVQHEVARVLSASYEISHAVQAIAEIAVKTTYAHGAYVERIDTPGPDGVVEVVATAGHCTLAVGTRIPYRGSLTEAVIESGKPVLKTKLHAVGIKEADYLRECCRHCWALVVPLTAKHTKLGAIILLRGRKDSHFTAEDETQLRTLSELATDAFKRLLLRERLVESETRFRQIIDNLREVVWLASPDLSEQYYVNPAYERVWGRSRESFYQQPRSPFDAIVPEDRSRVREALEYMYREERDIEYRIVRPDGEVRWIRSRVYPIRNGKGEVYRVAGIAEDITDRKEAALRLERLLRREREARQEIDTLLESISEAFFAVDSEWRITYLNHEAERILRRPREALLMKNIWAEYPDLRGTVVERESRRAMTERVTVEQEFYYEPEGIWLDLRVYPSVRGLSVFFRDVTERKRGEEALRQSERNLRALADSIPHLTWMADADGGIFWYNQRWYEFSGATFEELEGWRWQELIPPDQRAEVVTRIRTAFQSGEPWEDTIPLRSRTGEYRWFLTRAVPVRDTDGRVVRWLGTDTDITDRIEAEAERTRLLERERVARAEADRRRAELEHVSRSRTRLIRGFSHDVKNPLGAADGFLQLMEEGAIDDLTPKQEESVAKARNAIRTALELIDELLTVARAQAGKIEVNSEPTELLPLLRSVAESYQARAAAEGLELTTNLPDSLPTNITDAARVRQILGNLLSNAVKFTERGGITITAELSDVGPEGEEEAKAPPGRWIAISVIDTGPGIPAEKMHLLFHEFGRLSQSEDAEGSGIGLSISQKIAHALGGRITVKSEVGKGSTFTLWLPLVEASDTAQ